MLQSLNKSTDLYSPNFVLIFKLMLRIRVWGLFFYRDHWMNDTEWLSLAARCSQERWAIRRFLSFWIIFVVTLFCSIIKPISWRLNLYLYVLGCLLLDSYRLKKALGWEVKCLQKLEVQQPSFFKLLRVLDVLFVNFTEIIKIKKNLNSMNIFYAVVKC